MDDNSNQSDRKPGTFQNAQIQYNQPFDAVRFDTPADNDFISKGLGIKFAHYICMPDPLYNVQQGDVRATYDSEDNQQFVDTTRFHRENEFLYIRKGEVYGIFQNNSKDLRAVAAGLYSDSGAMVTLDRYYIGTSDVVKISEDDKLVPCELPTEFFSVNWQKFTHNPTGIDRMQFKVCNVEVLIDNAGVMYLPDVDFKVVDGCIRWLDGANRPGMDSRTGEGRVCSIRYTYKPYFYVKLVPHDIRVRPAMDQLGNITAKAAPVMAVLQADWIYLDRRTANEKDTAAQLTEGDGSNTGPR